MEKMMKPRQLPTTDSIEELAKFWDSHDLTDFENDLIEVKEPVFARGDAIHLRLKSSDAKAVAQIARKKGISQEELIRKWILQQLSRRNGAQRGRTRGRGKHR
jgi:predicted DNA binding CopG/RHH family protein